MKRCIPLLVALCFVLLQGSAVAAADPKTKVSVSTSTSLMRIGESFQVQIQADNAVHLAGISYTLHYDPTKMELAKDANGEPLITMAADFIYYGGRAISESEGQVFYPLVYNNPLVSDPISVPVMTLTFTSLQEGTASFLLRDIKVINYVSKTMQENGTADKNVITGPTLTPPQGEVKFSVKSVLTMSRQPGEAVLDFDGNGVMDKADVVFVLKHIEPLLLSPNS